MVVIRIETKLLFLKGVKESPDEINSLADDPRQIYSVKLVHAMFVELRVMLHETDEALNRNLP